VTRRSYQQDGGVAAALDSVGDRWTLLILRELSFGRQRFSDLRNALRGIASNLLAERLRDLACAGLVEQRELPAARTVYALTPQGERIRPVLAALTRFGLPFLEDPVDGQVRPRVAVHGALAALLDPARAPGPDLLVRFDLDGEVLHLQVRGGRLVRADSGDLPDLVLTGSAAALVDVCRGAAGLEEVAPRLVVAGSAAARVRFAHLFSLG
jgi:DNA-binding HxlR family transcriptional regulator